MCAPDGAESEEGFLNEAAPHVAVCWLRVLRSLETQLCGVYVGAVVQL